MTGRRQRDPDGEFKNEWGASSLPRLEYVHRARCKSFVAQYCYIPHKLLMLVVYEDGDSVSELSVRTLIV